MPTAEAVIAMIDEAFANVQMPDSRVIVRSNSPALNGTGGYFAPCSRAPARSAGYYSNS